jgi:hypothetical protein
VLFDACGAKTGLEAPDATVDRFMPTPEPEERCVELPIDAGPVLADFMLPVSLTVVDVMFLMDSTGSMIDEIDNVREGLRGRVAPAIRGAIPDAAFGVALVGEFPQRPHGPGDVRPYELRSPITRDLIQVEGAFESTPTWGNFDEPEAQVEALYQVATGEGLDPWVPASLGCPSGGSGGACFREDSLPVVMLVTDAPFHNGPRGVPPVDDYGFTPTPHTYAEAVAALRRIGAFVVGLGAQDVATESPMDHLRAIARDTGAVDEGGGPLAFDIGATGSRVGSGVVQAIERLASGVPLDVDASVADVRGDDIDATDLVVGVEAFSASPMSGVGGMEGDTFLAVIPGTQVTFRLRLDRRAVEPLTETLFVPARVVFRAFGRSMLGDVAVTIVIVGDDGGGCP